MLKKRRRNEMKKQFAFTRVCWLTLESLGRLKTMGGTNKLKLPLIQLHGGNFIWIHERQDIPTCELMGKLCDCLNCEFSVHFKRD